MTVLLAVQAIATCVVLAVLGYLVIRAPRNVPLRAVTITVASFSLTVVFGSAATKGSVILGLEPIMSRLVQHLGMIAGGYSLITFFLFSALTPREAWRRARLQAIPLGVAAAALVADVLVMPAAVRTPAATLAFVRPGSGPLDQVTVAGVYLVPNAYVVYAFATALVWTRRHATGAEPRLRRGLWLTSIGLSSLVFGESVFVAGTLVDLAGVKVPPPVFGIGLLTIIPGSVFFMVGLAYPAARTRLAAIRVWWDHRRVYHRLAPLWTLLHQQFPEDAFGRVPANRWLDTIRVRGVHRRYYRRVIECRDGLLRISPYLAGGNGRSLADQVREALRARAANTPVPHQAVPVAAPVADGIDADARELLALADELRLSR